MSSEIEDSKKSHLSDKDYNSKVILQMTGIISQDPNDCQAYVMRGNHYLDANKLQEAISDFSKAIQLDPTDPIMVAKTTNPINPNSVAILTS